MYGRIGSFTAAPGQRDALVAILTDAAVALPGCLAYVVATDPADAETVWISEVWDSEASHKASLAMPAVKAAIGKAMPLIAAIGDSRVVTPVAILGGRP